MDVPKDPATIFMAAILGLGGGSVGTLLDLGGMKEKMAHCEAVNAKQWEKYGELKARIQELELHSKVNHP